MNDSPELLDLGSRWNIVTPNWISGGNGRVYKAHDLTGQINDDVAIKVLWRLDRYVRFKVETFTAAELNHRNIVSILDSHLPASAQAKPPPYIVMPWYENGALSAQLGCPRDTLFHYLRQLLEAVNYIHNLGKAHRDIKPSNLLLDSENILKLADFGLVFDIDDIDRNTLSDEIVGSIGYRAPELMNGRSELPDHRPADIYSIGRTIWALAAGDNPRDGQDLNLPPYNLTELFDAGWLEIQDLIRLTTALDPNMRPKISELIDHLGQITATPSVASTVDASATVALLDRAYANDGHLIQRQVEANAKRKHNEQVMEFKKQLIEAGMSDSTFDSLKSSAEASEHIEVMCLFNENDGRIHFCVSIPSSPLSICAYFCLRPVHPNQFRCLTYVEMTGDGEPPRKYPDSEVEFQVLITETKRQEVLNLIPRQMNFLAVALAEHTNEKLYDRPHEE